MREIREPFWCDQKCNKVSTFVFRNKAQQSSEFYVIKVDGLQHERRESRIIPRTLDCKVRNRLHGKTLWCEKVLTNQTGSRRSSILCLSLNGVPTKHTHFHISRINTILRPQNTQPKERLEFCFVCELNSTALLDAFNCSKPYHFCIISWMIFNG